MYLFFKSRILCTHHEKMSQFSEEKNRQRQKCPKNTGKDMLKDAEIDESAAGGIELHVGSHTHGHQDRPKQDQRCQNSLPPAAQRIFILSCAEKAQQKNRAPD